MDLSKELILDSAHGGLLVVRLILKDGEDVVINRVFDAKYNSDVGVTGECKGTIEGKMQRAIDRYRRAVIESSRPEVSAAVIDMCSRLDLTREL